MKNTRKLDCSSIDVLGSEWRLQFAKGKPLDEDEDGLADDETRTITIDAELEGERKKRVIRHEVVHAYLAESGLDMSSLQPEGGWAMNEEMVDWFARQGPKIYKTWKKLGVVP